MKRKLSFAMALVGQPAVLLLDEPSTGMDPVARRHMWDAIAGAAAGRSIVLTTHLMEECEALCQRVGIMVGGRFTCLGTPQHLKNRFCSTYKLEFRCGGYGGGGGGEAQASEEAVVGQLQRRLSEFVAENFAGARLQEAHGHCLRFQVASEGLDLGRTFAVIEAAKEQLGVEDYAVSQGTLEEVFIRLAKGRGEQQVRGAEVAGGGVRRAGEE